MILKPHRTTGPHGRAGVFPSRELSASYLPNGGRDAVTCMETARRWMAAATDADMAAVELRAADLLRPDAAAPLPGPDVCHTAGGGPINVPASEAAPRRTWNHPDPDALKMSNRVKLARRRMERGSLPVADVLDMADNAARSTLQGKGFSDADREDAAQSIVLAILERVPDPAAARYPVRKIGYGWMCQRAADYRRGLDNQRRHDAEDAAREAARLSSPSVTYTLEDQRAETAPEPGTVDAPPVVARRRAVSMLRELGMLGDREPVRWGPVWTAAYSAARLGVRWDEKGRAAEADPSDVADELELTAATYRQHMSRAAERVPCAGVGRFTTRTLPTDAGHRAAAAAGTAPHGQPGSPAAVLAYIDRVERAAGDEPTETVRASLEPIYRALELPTDDAGTARKPSRTRAMASNARKSGTSGRADGWRGLDSARPAAQPCSCRWGKTRDRRRKLAQPSWALAIIATRPKRAAKLDGLSQRNAERIAARTGDERDELRASVGLPPVPAARRTP